MTRYQSISDKMAIGLSLACAIHCLALPLVLVIFPSITSLQLNNEAFHFWMLAAVIPASIYALTLGCKQHKHTRILAVGLCGVTIMVLALFVAGPIWGEISEKFFTLIGATLIAYSHVKNYRLCQSEKNCECSEHAS